jgi:Bacterial extracellular solute-binding protein
MARVTEEHSGLIWAVFEKYVKDEATCRQVVNDARESLECFRVYAGGVGEAMANAAEMTEEATPSMITRRKKPGRAIYSLFFLLLSFGVSHAQAKPAWQPEWEKVQSRAKKEGRIVVWGPPGAEARQALTQGFQKSFAGIEVEYSGTSGSKIAPRLAAERQAGQYLVDIHVGGTTTMLESLLDAKVLDPIQPALILPDVSDPKKWLQGRLDFSDREGRYNLVFSTNVKTPAAVNPQLVKKELLRSYWDLLHPQWSGKIVMRDPLTAGPGLATATFWYAQPGLGKEFMQKFFTQQKSSSRVMTGRCWSGWRAGTILSPSPRANSRRPGSKARACL